MIWMAPELLRGDSLAVRGTKEADVYAFAMVLYEIWCLITPFEDSAYAIEDVIAKIKAGKPIHRPEVILFNTYLLYRFSNCLR